MDDEQPARDRLRQLLAGEADVEIVGEAEDGVQAIERVAELAPDWCCSTSRCRAAAASRSRRRSARPRPAIIFCTAYDQYAVDAFELHAVDYLLKPVNRARLQAALERVRAAAPDRSRASARSRHARQQTWPRSRFLARKGARFRVVPRQEVVAFTFHEGLTRLHTATEQLWMQPTLAALARRLDGDTSSRSRAPPSSASTRSAKRSRFPTAPAKWSWPTA